MGVYVDRETTCERAGPGDVIVTHAGTFVVAEIDEWGRAVCRNLDPECMYSDEIRTFDDYDINRVVKKDDPVLFVGLYI